MEVGATAPGEVDISSVLSSIWCAGLLAMSSLCSCSDSSTFNKQDVTECYHMFHVSYENDAKIYFKL